MERLTKAELVNGIFVCYPQNSSGLLEYVIKQNPYRKIVEKLKEYEDLEEQQKLLKLPCAVGDTVYEISQKLLPLRVDSYEVKTDEIYANFVSDVYGYKYLKLCVGVADFGKTVFLTKEEAEAVLNDYKIGGIK